MNEQTKSELGRGRGISGKEKSPLLKFSLPIPGQPDLFGVHLFENLTPPENFLPARKESTANNLGIFFRELSRLVSLSTNGSLLTDYQQIRLKLLNNRLESFLFEDKDKIYRRFQDLGIIYDRGLLLSGGLLWACQSQRFRDSVNCWLAGETDDKPYEIKRKIGVFGSLANEISSSQEKPALRQKLSDSLYQDLKSSRQPESNEYYFPRLTRSILEILYRRLGHESHPVPDNALVNFSKQPGVMAMAYALEKILLLKMTNQLGQLTKNSILNRRSRAGPDEHELYQLPVTTTDEIRPNELLAQPSDDILLRKILPFVQSDNQLFSSFPHLSLKDLAEAVANFSVDQWLRTFTQTGRIKYQLKDGEYFMQLPPQLTDITNNPVIDINPSSQTFKLPIGFAPFEDYTLKLSFFLPCNPENIGYIMTTEAIG